MCRYRYKALTVIDPESESRLNPRIAENIRDREYEKLACTIRQVVYIMDSSSTNCIGSQCLTVSFLQVARGITMAAVLTFQRRMEKDGAQPYDHVTDI